MIACLVKLRARLPKVDDVTESDKLSVYSTTLVFVALAEVVLMSWLVQRKQPALAPCIDFHARWVYLLAFLTTVALLLKVALPEDQSTRLRH